MDPLPVKRSNELEFDPIRLDEVEPAGRSRASADRGDGSWIVDPDALRRRLAESVSSWGFSLALHLVLFFVLSLIVLHRPAPEPELTFAVALVVDQPVEPAPGPPPSEVPPPPPPPKPAPAEVEADDLQTPAAPEHERPAAAASAQTEDSSEGAPDPAPDPATEAPQAPELAVPSEPPTRPASGETHTPRAIPTPKARPVSGAAADLARLRSPSGRSRALGEYGGSAAGEAAVARGLDWLARHQSGDGGWRAAGFDEECKSPSCAGPGSRELSRGITGLALLAFLAGGHTHMGGTPYRHVMRRGIEHVLGLQDPVAGTFGEVRAKYVYHHAVLTYALAECLALTGDRSLRSPVAQAVQVLVHSQQDAGGWDYHLEPTGRSDASVTGFVLMALAAADLAEVGPPRSTWRRAERFLDLVTTDDHQVCYSVRNWRSDNRVSHPLTSVGLLSWLYVGQRPGTPVIDGLVDRTLSRAPREMFERGTPWSLYSWYYSSLALFHRGGGPWQTWNRELRDLLIGQQVRHDHAAGSWDPGPGMGDVGGRVMATALSVLILEVYYRYEPLHEAGYRKRSETKRRPVITVPAGDPDPEVPGPAAIARAARLAASDDQRVRDQAVKVLAAAGPQPSAIDGLILYLADSESSIRWQAVVALERCDAPECAPALVDRLPVETVTSLRGRIVIALGVLGDASAVPALAGLFLADDRSLDEKVMTSLQRLTGREAGGDFSRAGWLQWLETHGYVFD